MLVSIIVGMGKNREIGKDNKLLWHVPADLANFKRLTMNHHMVMGRKTYLSIGRPLPGRTTLILSHSPQKDIPAGCWGCGSLAEALELARQRGENELFIIGGGEVYRQALQQDLIDTIYLSRIEESYEADTFFPEFEAAGWHLESETRHDSEAGAPAWSYQVWKRIRN
jgi:dihydrofolate reductase